MNIPSGCVDRRPFEHLLVATDFSAGAAQAIARAALLPLAARGRVTVVHVLPDLASKKVLAEAEKLARRNLQQAVRTFGGAAALLGRRDLRLSSDLCHGPAYAEIIRHARSVAAELIVLGRHGRRPVRDMFIVSTAERVIRAGDLPVLIVSRRAARAYRRPLLAVDLDDASRAVVTVALRALAPEVTQATMIHAYHVPFEGFVTPEALPWEMTDARKEYRKAAASSLAKLQATLADGGMQWRTLLVCDDARNAIVTAAKRVRADLVAVGTHGRSGIAHALLGSVAEWVIQAAPCDVLVARPARVTFRLP